MALTIIAAYDIREDDRRARLAAMLQVHGDRIQKSVFLLTLDEDELTDLSNRCREVIDPNIDSLWFARQCQNCWREAIRIGQTDLRESVLHWAVF